MSRRSTTEKPIDSRTNLAMPSGKELDGHFEQDSEQLAEFLASKERLRERMAGARVEMYALRSQVAENRREFDTQLECLRKQVAPLLPAEHSVSKAPCAPPSTPAG